MDETQEGKERRERDKREEEEEEDGEGVRVLEHARKKWGEEKGSSRRR